MPEPAVSRLIDQRLRELYERHLEASDADVAQVIDAINAFK